VAPGVSGGIVGLGGLVGVEGVVLDGSADSGELPGSPKVGAVDAPPVELLQAATATARATARTLRASRRRADEAFMGAARG
jgi:hypothetical protein